MAKDEWVYLLHVDQQYQVDMMRDILQSREIPVVVKSKKGGAFMQVYMGMSWTGFDLYIPVERLDEARQLTDLPMIEPIMSEEEYLESQETDGQEMEAWNTNLAGQSSSVWYLITIVLFLLVVVLLVLRDYIF